MASTMKLTMLEGFRPFGDATYKGPNGLILPMRYVDGDWVAVAELKMKARMLDLRLISDNFERAFFLVLDSVIPMSCEECGGESFVQKIVFRNRRQIEILECASGFDVYEAPSVTRRCKAQHQVIDGRVVGLTPSEKQIEIARDVLFKLLCAEKAGEVSSPDCSEFQPDDEDDLYD